MITRNEVAARISYNKETGEFRSKIRTTQRKIGEVVGGRDARGYLKIQIMGKKYALHRLAFLLVEGSIPFEVDHINRNKEDNRWSNLRSCTKSENAMNRKIKSTNTSGHTGVNQIKSSGKYMARYKNKYLGVFETKEEAVLARDVLE